MNALLLSSIKIAPSEDHHMVKERPLYSSKFHKVFKYHEPGLAPVEDTSGAYHIDLKGQEAYADRFEKAFGFYQGVAAVELNKEWFHILPDGKPLYSQRYAWCGNYQEGICSVRLSNGKSFHIDATGQRLYEGSYAYVGDFKDGIAVVHDGRGCTHINSQGQFIHGQWYSYLDLFHKGFARAKDSRGWFHITTQGNPAYRERFQELEPFYNGAAVAVDQIGRVVLLNENGDITGIIKDVDSQDYLYQLSADMTGFWKLEFLKLAVESKIIDHLPASCVEIAQQTGLSVTGVVRFMRALEEMGLVEKLKQMYAITEKGKLLTPSASSFMAAAVVMWKEVQNQWKKSGEVLKVKDSTYHPTFKEKSMNSHSIALYQRAIDGYAHLDFKDIHKWIDWERHNTLLGLGRPSITAIQTILQNYSHIHGTVYNEDALLNHFIVPSDLKTRFTAHLLDLFSFWPDFTYDGILLPRFMPYFPDAEAQIILSQIKKSLSKVGRLYIFELILSSTNSQGGMLDMNMLIESGGGLRTLGQWTQLLQSMDMTVSKFDEIFPHLHLLTIENGDS